MIKLTKVKQPSKINIAFQPIAGTTVLLKTTPITLDIPNPVKKSAFTRTPSLYRK